MQQTYKLIVAALASVAGVVSGPLAASAQDASGLGHPEFFVTPYLWLAGVYATTQTGLDRIPTVNSNVGPFQMLGHLDGAPFLGSAEIRDGPIGILGDVLHIPVSTNITTRNVLFQGGTAELAANTGTALVLYRVFAAPEQYADFGLGFRAWGFSSRVSLNPGLLSGIAVNKNAGWGDPLLAGRYHYDFSNGIGLTAYGDCGGFGLGAHTDWQLIGTVDYALTASWNLHLGYRSLNFNYSASDSNLGFNVHMRGPILAATFRF